MAPPSSSTEQQNSASASSSMFDGLNASINNSAVGRYFEMEARGTNFTTELRGAIATFLTMAYILAVNPRILGDSGGPCVPDFSLEKPLFASGYVACLEEVKREYITGTAISSMIGCLLMGFMANLPIALAPGMGMNAYFTYSVVGWRGTGDISYEAAVTAVLIEGCIFLVLAVTGIRYAIIRFVPTPVRLATPAAIGAFLAHLGLQTAEGIGIVVSDIATAVTLGACEIENRVPIVALTEACIADRDDCTESDAYTCDDLGGVMESATTWIGMLGMILMAILFAYKVNMAFVAGIGFVTVVSWFRNTAVTYFPDDEDGDARFEYFKQVVSIESFDKTLAPFTGELSGVAVALITMLYVDFLDTSGTLMALAYDMGLTNEEGDFPRSRWAFAADATATLIGSFFGLSPVTSYIESGAGVATGSRTGLTAVLCGFFFFLSIFFAPLIASIPPWATGGSLIIVGAIMSKSLKEVQWHNPTHALTAFLTVLVMPLTYSIAYGLIAGICTYFIMEGTFRLLEFVGIPKPDYSVEPRGEPMVNPAGSTTAKKDVDNSQESEEQVTSSPEEAAAEDTADQAEEA